MLSATATYGETRPLEVLSELIEKRVKKLGEMTEDAIIATGIDALVSLRAATLCARPEKQTSVKVELDYSLVASHTREGGSSRRCVRNRAGVRIDAMRRLRFACGAGVPDRNLYVYRVTPEHENVSPYLVVAESASDAEKFEQTAARHRKGNFAGLAKTALGVAMAKISTKNPPTPAFKRRIADSEIIDVRTSGGNGQPFQLDIHDKLGYSVAALRGGRGAVNIALMKAANKIAGNISRKMNALGSLEDVPTPFPEVKRRR